MLVIRFFRVGKKNQPSFKIVVTEKTNPTHAGRYVEEVGFYNPLTKEKRVNTERMKYWMSQGAQPSDTVFNILVDEKIVKGKKKKPQHKVIAATEKKETTQPVAAAEKPAA